MVSAAFPDQKRSREGLGRHAACIEMRKVDPIVLLHGKALGRCIAQDLSSLPEARREVV
jgi:hypothetical protein